MIDAAERHKRILRKYGLTEEQWQIIANAQRNRCAICIKPFSRARLACVDHDHETGLVRGLLCTACNYAVGERHDDVEWFRNAAKYLDMPTAPHEGIVVYVPGSIGASRVG
jgi:hypothetical protein